MHADATTRHVTDVRPWGRFEQYCHNEVTTVKVITIEPGHRLSLQRHARRSEYWVVLDGPMDITVGDRSWRAEPGERIWIPLGATHRVGNPGTAAARVLELAYGEFDESDIERLEDDYSR
ncbi:MAG: phosphomannose isomerase type II C-terminal cupin domain [Dermatophilaceae bacterium]|nr:phosphomannose isomerase type II C-terminal cupin domain [Intrasporangiaceae bacterium]